MLEMIFGMLAIVISLLGSYFVTKSVDNTLTGKKEIVRFILISLTSTVTFAALMAGLLAILYFTLPNQGFSR